MMLKFQKLKFILMVGSVFVGLISGISINDIDNFNIEAAEISEIDISVFRPSNVTWYYDFESNGNTDKTKQWGFKTDLPIVGDFDRDGIIGNVGVFCPSSGTWYFDNDLDGNTDETMRVWGTEGDLPVVGDFDSDGFSDDIAVFRGAGDKGYWYFNYDHIGHSDEGPVLYGNATDLPVAGDFDSDGYNDDIGVFRNGNWYFDYNHNGNTDISILGFSVSGDLISSGLPIAGDFDGDGFSDDIGIFRSGVWYIDYNHSGDVDVSIVYGALNDLPIVGYFNEECAPKAYSACYNYNVYWFDSCNNKGELKESCGCGCNNNVCIKPCVEEPLPDIQVSLGQEEIVFDWTTDRCDNNDISDVPARAFRDKDNKIQMIATHYTNRRFIGNSFDNLQRDCSNIILESDNNSDPSQFNDKEWMCPVYTLDGENIYSLVFNSYNGYRHQGMCKSGNSTSCWYGSITSALSDDMGKSYYQEQSPNHQVASPSLEYSIYSANPSGYFEPSNIFQGEDDYYYVLVRAGASYEYDYKPDGTILQDINSKLVKRKVGFQESGACIMRTSNINELTPGEETKWLLWDGQDFTIEKKDPYREIFNPEEQSCATLNNKAMRYSVTWNTYLNKYILVDVYRTPEYGYGFYFSLSDNLIKWSEPQLIMTAEEKGAFEWEVYPSVIDHEIIKNGVDIQTRNFDKSDNTFYLYFTRMNYWNDPQRSFDRDLVRVSVTLTANFGCNSNSTDFTGKCSVDCGASAACAGIAPNACSSNSLKKCDSNCQEVISCNDGICNCEETSENCLEDCPVINHLPIGSLDSADQTQITGWAYDEDSNLNPIDVHIYIDGNLVGSSVANQSRPDLVSAGVAPDPNHGFSFSTPSLSVGKHTINVYAINTPQGTNPELNGSPIVFNILTPDPDPNPDPTLSPSPSPPPSLTPPSYPEQTLLKSPDSFKIYIIINQKKKWISTPEVFETLGYQWTNITIIEKNELTSIPDYEDNLIRAINDFKVYLIVNGIKRHIPNSEIFLDYGFEWNDIKEVNQETINQYTTSILIKESKKEEIYYLCPERKIKRWLQSPEIFNSYNNKWEDIQVISKYELDSYPESNLIKLHNSNDVYLIEGNRKKLIKSVEEFNRLGLDWGRVMEVGKVEFNWFGN